MLLPSHLGLRVPTVEGLNLLQIQRCALLRDLDVLSELHGTLVAARVCDDSVHDKAHTHNYAEVRNELRQGIYEIRN